MTNAIRSCVSTEVSRYEQTVKAITRKKKKPQKKIPKKTQKQERKKSQKKFPKKTPENSKKILYPLSPPLPPLSFVTWLSLEHAPSHPMATFIPFFLKLFRGATPLPSLVLLTGLWTATAPVEANTSCSSSS